MNSRPTRQRTPVSRGLNSVNYLLPACAASSAGHYVAALMMAPSQSVIRPFFSVFLSRRRFLFSASLPPYEGFSLFMDNTMGEGRISIPPLPLFLSSLRVMNRLSVQCVESDKPLFATTLCSGSLLLSVRARNTLSASLFAAKAAVVNCALGRPTDGPDLTRSEAQRRL